MSAKNGFTLLELSIVLVIIGLIVGGVVAGRELIRNAEINALISDVNQIKTAFNNFRYKYDAIPGDFKQGSEYFTSVWADGDGNGEIDNWSAESADAYRSLYEAELLLFKKASWAPLNKIYRGGSIDEGFTYLHFNDIYGYHFSNTATFGEQPRFGNAITFAGNPQSDGNVSDGILIPSEAQSIDNKIDDGAPFSGKAIGRLSNQGDCYTGNAYDLAEETDTCRMMFFFD